MISNVKLVVSSSNLKQWLHLLFWPERLWRFFVKVATSSKISGNNLFSKFRLAKPGLKQCLQNFHASPFMVFRSTPFVKGSIISFNISCLGRLANCVDKAGSITIIKGWSRGQMSRYKTLGTEGNSGKNSLRLSKMNSMIPNGWASDGFRCLHWINTGRWPNNHECDIIGLTFSISNLYMGDLDQRTVPCAFIWRNCLLTRNPW